MYCRGLAVALHRADRLGLTYCSLATGFNERQNSKVYL